MRHPARLIPLALLMISLSGLLTMPTRAQIIRSSLSNPIPFAALSPIEATTAADVAELANFRHYNTGGQPSHLIAVALRADGQHMAILTPTMLQVWDLTTATLLMEIPATFPIDIGRYIPPVQMRFSGDGQGLVIWHSRYQPTLHVWDVARQQQLIWSADILTRLPVYLGGQGLIVNAAFTPDSRALLLYTRDGMIEQRDFRSGDLQTTWQACPQPENQPVSSAFSLAGDQLACAFGDTIRVYETTTGTLRRTIAIGEPTTALAFSPNGALLARQGSSVQVWNLEAESMSGTPIPAPSESHPDPIAVTDSGLVMVTQRLITPADGQLQLWDGATGVLLVNLPNPDWIVNMQLSADNKLVMTADGEGRIRLFGAPPCTLTATGPVNLRTLPTTDSDIGERLSAGEAVFGDAQTSDGTYPWWRLTSGLWVRADVITASPACERLPSVPFPN